MLTVRGSILVCTRQILKTKVDPHAVRVDPLGTKHDYSRVSRTKALLLGVKLVFTHADLLTFGL